jgi:cell cycle sensor histidine kinase DivJ
VIEARLAGLVHDQVQDPVERSLHERFIVTRMFTGVIALAFLPGYLLWRGVPSGPEYAAILCLVAPVMAALVLARTGWLALAQAISSAALAGLIVCIAATGGGLASAATTGFVAIPLEALLSGSRRAVLAAGIITILALMGLAGLDLAGLTPVLAPWPIALAIPAFVTTAIGHAAALALDHSRRDQGRRADVSARDARDRSLLQAIDDLVTWHDRNGHVLEASVASVKLLGVVPAALRGRGLLSRVHVSDRPAFLQAISDAACSDRPICVQFRLHVGSAGEAGPGSHHASPKSSQDGARVIWAETRAHRIAPATAQDIQDHAVVAVTRDISEHKLHEEQLEHARAEAERADLSKGRFLATVSHELRTPLNAIIGFSEMLATEGALAIGPERRQEYAQIIHESGQHLLGVVNTLLDMSKIESGAFEFVPEPFDAASLVHGCCDLMQLKAEQAGILLARDVARDLPELVADGRACRQILINLISNAVKFTPRGGRVGVAIRRERDRMLFTVSDNGIGIAEADLPRIGDPFFQAGSAYTRAHEGTGLGLSVVRGLVGLHHGDLTIESELAAGTTATVSLPLDCRTGKPQAGGAVRINARPRRSPKLTDLRAG